MATIQAKSEFQKAFTARTKQARKARGFTQAQISDILRISQDMYKHYEKRSLLPHHMIATFCIVCGITEKWLLSAKGPGPIDQQQIAA